MPYREDGDIWSKYVSVTVHESSCWMGEEGVGRRFSFTIYEPSKAVYTNAVIENTSVLSSVLGVHAQDLLSESKTSDMCLFILRNRMILVKNTFTWDGEPIEEDVTDMSSHPVYRVEFKKDRIYGENKITPINLNQIEDELRNQSKLFRRGKQTFFPSYFHFYKSYCTIHILYMPL